MQLSVKDVEEEVFREFKSELVREGLTIGRALTLAMQLWLERVEQKPTRSLLSLKPMRWGKGTERTSEEIDRIAGG
ncbi:MAG TPA: hypothetical protein VJB16_00715 [archaeon]|nr:hypothetical protein [archaeon]